jgi:hypothetical protein
MLGSIVPPNFLFLTENVSIPSTSLHICYTY